jgi:hypothetical protein
MSRAEVITAQRGGQWFGCYGRITDRCDGAAVLVRDADAGAVLFQLDAGAPAVAPPALVEGRSR